MPKRPAIMLYTGDWKKDPELSQCGPATRGVWLDMLCAMHDGGETGELSGTAPSLARVCRCSPEELLSAVAELEATRAADVERDGEVIRVVNRKMREAHQARHGSRERMRRMRERRSGGGPAAPRYADVTPMLRVTPASQSRHKNVTRDGMLRQSDVQRNDSTYNDLPQNQGPSDANVTPLSSSSSSASAYLSGETREIALRVALDVTRRLAHDVNGSAARDAASLAEAFAYGLRAEDWTIAEDPGRADLLAEHPAGHRLALVFGASAVTPTIAHRMLAFGEDHVRVVVLGQGSDHEAPAEGIDAVYGCADPALPPESDEAFVRSRLGSVVGHAMGPRQVADGLRLVGHVGREHAEALVAEAQARPGVDSPIAYALKVAAQRRPAATTTATPGAAGAPPGAASDAALAEFRRRLMAGELD